VTTALFGVALRIRGLGVAVGAFASFATPSVANADATRIEYSPYIAARFSDSATATDVGLEAFPMTSGVGGRLIVGAGKGDPSDTQGAASTEKGRLALKGQLVAEFGATPRDDYTVVPSRFGLVLTPEWSVNRYSYNPQGGAKETDTFHSWKLGLWLWWFGGIGVDRGNPPIRDSSTGNPPLIVSRSFATNLIQPQLRVTYARTFKEQDDSYVVREPADGIQLAEKLKIAAPSAKPTLTVLAALPIQLRNQRFAFGPAISLTFTGLAGEYAPLDSVARIRAETWVYYFAFEDKAAVRVGVAPFIDARITGNDKRDGFIAGV
jgi:hypothetical protein